jgi:hypothetical protein
MYATKNDAMGVSQDGERPQHGQNMSKHVKTTDDKLLMFARFAWIWGVLYVQTNFTYCRIQT